MTRRLVLSMTALVAVVALALAIPLAVIVAHDQRTQFINRLEVATMSASSRLASQPFELWPDEVAGIANDTGARVVVVDTKKNLVADSADSTLDRTFDRPEITEALAGSLTTDVRYSSTLGTNIRYVAAPIVQREQVSSAIRLSLPEDEVTAVVRRTLIYLALFVLAVVVIAAAIAVMISRSIASPLRRLAAVAHDLPTDLAIRADATKGPGEVREVAGALNSTAAKLEGILARTQRVAADASHHLRTPLTGMRLRLEAIEDISTDEGNREVAEQAAAATAEVDRLTHRIEQVLALSRMDAGVARVDRVNASQIVRARIEEAAHIAAESDIELGVRVDDAVFVESTPGSIARMIDELLGNAFIYAASRVEVTLHGDDATATLTVSDDGPGVPEDDRARIFERFQRGSTAKPGGSGLGLALVQETARSLGGDAHANASDSGGLAVVVTLPRVQ